LSWGGEPADDRRAGAWGTAIVSNDTAGDVRERYRALVVEGLSAADAGRPGLVRQFALA